MIDLNDAPNAVKRPVWQVLGHLAAVALERQGHAPGVVLQSVVNGAARQDEVRWSALEAGVQEQEERNRATELGAEGIAIALAWQARGWRVVKRLTSRRAERADWVLEDAGGARYILEVSGTERGDLERLRAIKLAQARSSPLVPRARAAVCVVRFEDPRSIFEVDDGSP